MRCPRIIVAVLVVVNPHVASLAQALRAPGDVVREELRAKAEADLNGLLAVFSQDASVFSLPENPDRLVGRLSEAVGTDRQRKSLSRATLAKESQPRREIVDTVAVADLLAIKFRTGDAPGRSASNLLSLYRVRDGRIRHQWHIAETKPASHAKDDGVEVIRRLVAANNKGDAASFLALFSPDAKIFRPSADPDGLADVLSERMSDQESRRKIIMALFAKGSPGQAAIMDILALGDLVVTHDRVTMPTQEIVDQLKIYRVRSGLITHDWTVYEQQAR